MPEANPTHLDQLPTSRQLARSTLLAAAIAAVLLATVVLPAEYGIDPTGIGQLLGLKQMGELKLALAQEAQTKASTKSMAPPTPASADVPHETAAQAPSMPAAPAPGPSQAMAQVPTATAQVPTATAPTTPAPPSAPSPAQAAVTSRTDVTSITLQPNEGKEIKLEMRQQARVVFSWSTDRGVVNYDLHADSTEPPRDYHGYRKGNGLAMDQGTLEAAFDGWHGWYWRNRTSAPLTVTLKTQGAYQNLKEMQ